MAGVCGRTAPSSTGPAHPGTLLSALVAWLQARSAGGRFFVRLEDQDRQRAKPAYAQDLVDTLLWLGLDFDFVERQSEQAARHAGWLRTLAAQGLLYVCDCTRARLRALPSAHAALGTASYDNHCRARGARVLPAQVPDGAAQAPTAAPQATPVPVWRLHLAHAQAHVGGSPSRALSGHGDPIVRRRDGSTGFALAAAVDDAAHGVSHVVRGYDLAVHAPLHAFLHGLLGHAPPVFLHHPLLMAGAQADAAAASKLSKLHGSLPVGPRAPRPTHWPSGLPAPQDAAGWVGLLAQRLGLAATAAPATPRALLPQFAWARLPAAQLPLWL